MADDEVTDALGPKVPTFRVAFFELPEYDSAFGEWLNDTMHALAAARNSMLAEMPRVRVRRTYRGRNSIGTSGAVETPPLATRSSYIINHDTIVNCDAEGLLSTVDEIAGQYATAVTSQIFESLSSVTDAFGNTHDGGGQPLTVDLYLQVLSQMEVAFDDDDNPVLPTVRSNDGVEIPLPEFSSAQQARLEEILEPKRIAHLARRRHRELSRHPLGS